ncbi:filaggrin-like [Armigeres subalbatus]|uniref:filaggrin-like n=1 Tax=Armigeres subalbatus TaxID=124917 RepID=UPI002ED32928
MDWKLLLVLGGTIIACSSSATPRASSYIFRSFDTPPGHVVYLSPSWEEPNFPKTKKFEKIIVKPNVDFDNSEELIKTDISEEDESESKVLPLKNAHHLENSEETYGEEQSSKKGRKNRKGYKSKHSLQKGSKGSYDDENHSHSYDNEGDRKKSYHDEDGYEKNHHDEGHSVKGGKHGEKKSHKKGSKTTGYHNVYHKDEFKKEHIFYDTADHSGNFKKYGSSHKEHSNDEEQFAKGGHNEAAHARKKYSKKGHSEDGKHDSNHREYKNQRGDTKEYRDAEEYQNKNGKLGSLAHGYKIYHT